MRVARVGTAHALAAVSSWSDEQRRGFYREHSGRDLPVLARDEPRLLGPEEHDEALGRGLVEALHTICVVLFGLGGWLSCWERGL